jgi:DNA-binding NtrC family response regulator/class 3 adenylate cyclase
MAMRYRSNPRGNEMAVTPRVTTVNGPGPEAGDTTAERGLSPSSNPTARLVGHSPAIGALRAQIRRLATFDTIGNLYVPTLLLQGETGAGKGLVARVIHDSGPRAHSPFLEVNCAAIPETLLEAELFGFEAGAFTDAKRAKPGLFEAASGGTLFLDEVDTLTLALQSKLLNAIEAKRIRRLGAVAERPVDVKLIAATSTDLSRHVSEKRFRADLYYRLAVVLLRLPPLRERGEDCLVLAQHFLQRYAAAHGLHPKRLSRVAEAWLLGYDWPGNVRELSHLMERVTLLSPETILDRQILERLCLPRLQPSPQPESIPVSGELAPLDEPTRIRHTLIQAEGNVARAARLLGMSRGTLRYRMRRYGIERPSRKDPVRLSGSLSEARAPHLIPLPLRGRSRFESSSESQDQARHPPVNQEQPALEPRWEQKPVVVLAISLTFSEAMSFESLRYDPWTVTAHWEQRIVEQLTGLGGIILQRSPSLSTAAFGVPRTPEQLPQRTVQAALAVRHVVAEMRGSDARGAGVDVRLAVHKGMALVDVQTCNPKARVLPMADALMLTLRLLGHAAPGEILLSAQVGRLVEVWYELQAREVLLGDRPLDRTSAYVVVGLAP